MAKICRSCNCCTTSYALTGVENVTDVDDYHSTPVDPFKPYPRPVDATHIPGCADGPPADDTCGGSDQPPCNEWERDARPIDATCLGVFKEWNCYDIGTATTVARLKRGFKAVQAWKQWHGRPDFLSNGDACDCMARKRFRTIKRKIKVDLTL